MRLLQLASPALPIGAFHFSQGLEYAVEAKWVRDEATALEWIGGLADNALATLDLPVLARLHRSRLRGDRSEFSRWAAFLIAARETEELRAEDRHMGAALLKILVDLDVPGLDARGSGPAPGYAAVFAQACIHWRIPQADALQAYAWVWAESQTLAAVKLVPLGQSAGQRILHALIPRLSDMSNRAQALADDDIGIAAPMQALASARHESQYTRLFRS
jgi:urease accessory protein